MYIVPVFTPERSKEEIQKKKSQDQTLRAEAVQSLYNKELCQCQASIFDTANHKKSQCDFAFKADQVPKL
jgi:hypothetical protein